MAANGVGERKASPAGDEDDSEWTDASGSSYETETESESDKEEAKPAPPPKKKGRPLTRVETMIKRGLLLATALFVAQYFGVSAACGHPDIEPSCSGLFWPPHMFNCPTAGYECTSSAECVEKTAYPFMTCFDGRCKAGLDMHAVCYCACTPVNFMTILDVTIGNVFLICLWFAGELSVKLFDEQLGRELNAGRRWQERINKREGFDLKARIANVRHSWQWNDELNGWQERASEQKSVWLSSLTARAYGFYLGFFALAMFEFWVIIKGIAPQQMPPAPYTSGSIEEVIYLLVSFGDIQLQGFYTFIILIQFGLEFGLFMLCAATVRWPRPALVRSRTLKHKPNVNFAKSETEAVRLADEHNGLIQDTCLLIACHESCLTKDAKGTFTNTLQVAMDLFPAEAIFVCDNGGYKQPVDRTQEVCDRLSLKRDKTGTHKIQYLFIPEGNKSHAMYWTTEYWIPELVRRGESHDFQYAIIIDDDVPLPPDLHVPLHTLARNKEIKAVSYVIMAASEDGSENQLVSLQDAEYKLAGFVKQFQWKFGSTACCHGAIGLWRRDVLGRTILWKHDTMFHGEDLYMGLLLHRERKNYTIMVSAGAVVPTFAPPHMLMLFRQRVSSWDLCTHRKWLSFVIEFMCGWCNTRTLILKPFLLQEILNVLIDWLRLYLMIGLGHRNAPSLLIVFVLFYALLYCEIMIFNYGVLRDREDLRMTRRTIIMFPFYRTWELLFRLHALLKNVIEYAPWRRKNETIAYREESVHDLPPVPPEKNPDWWTVWHANKEQNSDTRFKKLTNSIVKGLEVDADTRKRLKPLASAYLMWQKLRLENFSVQFPQMLASHGDADGAKVLQGSMQDLQELFERKLASMVPEHQWEEFETHIQMLLERWARAQDAVLFANMSAFNEDNNQTLFCVRSNHHILNSNIRALVYYTRWPANNDPVSDLKEAIEDLLRLLDIKIGHLENPGDYQDMEAERELNLLVEALVWVQEVCDQQRFVDLDAARERLQYVERTLPTLNLQQDHINNINTVLFRNKDKLEVLEARRAGAGVGAPPTQ